MSRFNNQQPAQPKTDAILETIEPLETKLSSIKLSPFLDLTLLDEHASPKAIDDMVIKATQNQVAAVCVFPQHLDNISSKFHGKLATVINFPTGNESQHHLLSMLHDLARLKKVNEVDYVFPYPNYLSGKQHDALFYCNEIALVCRQYNLTFKVILETGALPSNELIYDLSCKVIQSGCDFLKTSTGKTTTGATIPAVSSMLNAIKDSQTECGIKISGGIRTREQALSYLQLTQNMINRPLDPSWFRIGTSSLLA
jgi:deoxyribose-phosphate aldolase